MPAIASDNENKAPDKHKRKLTEARREQNRRAQRAWREKQKQRRDEEIQAKVQLELGRRDALQGEPQLDAKPRPRIPSRHVLAFASPETVTATGMSQLQFGVTGVPVPDDGTPTLVDSEKGSSLPADPLVAVLPDPVMPLPVAVYYYFPPDPDSEDMRYAWECPEGTESKLYLPQSSSAASTSLVVSPVAQQSSHLRTSPQSSLYSSSSSSSSLVPSLRPRENCLPFSTPDLPSPYLNHLQLVGESCFAATLSIAQCLGISRPSYVNDHPSPFSTSSNTNIHTIPVDIRPTGYQLIIPHPCYLDCIPFPHFRSMAIYLGSLKRLDHMSLFLDLMHDGLVCWGRTDNRSMRDGVAWSKRSWEARPWFWRKWSWIAKASVEDIDAGDGVGHNSDEFDDEDGMLSGSQWWWSLHGDTGAGQTALTHHQDVNPMMDDDDAITSAGGVLSHQPELEEFGSLLSRHVTANVSLRKPEEIYHWD